VEQQLIKLCSSDYYFNSSYYIKRGFNLFNKNIGLSVVASLILLTLYLLSSLVPLGSLLLAWPLSSGFFIFAKKLANDEEIELNNFFEGFNSFGNLFVAYIIVSFFTMLGVIAFIIPGIYLAVALILVQPIITFSEIKPIDAVKYSRIIVTKHWFEFLIIGLFVAVLNIVGALLLGIGLLFTIPISFYIQYAIFEDIILDNKPFEKEDDIPSADELGLDLDDYFKKLEE